MTDLGTEQPALSSVLDGTSTSTTHAFKVVLLVTIASRAERIVDRRQPLAPSGKKGGVLLPNRLRQLLLTNAWLHASSSRCSPAAVEASRDVVRSAAPLRRAAL
jgi:hypothetical protein